MEPIFSNACVYSQENLGEMTRATMPTWYKVYCFMFAAFFFILAGTAVYIKNYMFAILFVVFTVLLIIIYYTRASVSAKKAYRRNSELFHKEVETRVFFYDDVIIGKNLQAGSAVKTEYSRIKLIKETKNLYVLKIPENMAILVDKNGFISENGDKFLDFIKQKCPAAKVK